MHLGGHKARPYGLAGWICLVCLVGNTGTGIGFVCLVGNTGKSMGFVFVECLD